MNGLELGRSVVDLALGGRKVKGTVAAILPSQDTFIQRYAVRTDCGEIVDAQVSDIESVLGLFFLFRDPKKIGEQIKERAIEVRPWVDGQIL